MIEVRETLFPLRVAQSGRYLVDAVGTPFLLHCDTAWSLLVSADEAGAERYLADRAAKGFNAIIVNLIEALFCPDPPRTVNGIEPLTTSGDFRTPNDAYFDHAVTVVERAHAHGILVLLAPAYLGYIDPHYPGFENRPEGWYAEVKASGVDACEAYGRYVGQRFRDLPNVCWVMGGDRDPGDVLEHVRAMARALQGEKRDGLFTAHVHPEHRPLEHYPDDPWLTVNQTYNYSLLHRALLAEYMVEPPMPNFLFESSYEREHDSSELQIRRQAYWALTCGGFGHCFGAYPIWFMDGNWEAALDSPGASQMQHVKALFASLPWWQLIPDTRHAVVIDGLGEFRGLDLCTTAITRDGTVAVSYLPTARPITVDFRAFAQGRVRVTWHDPVQGARIAGGIFQSAGQWQLEPPDDQDWAVLFESVQEEA